MAAWSDHEQRDPCKSGAVICPICDGTGSVRVEPPIKCAACRGTGVVTNGELHVPRKLFFILRALIKSDDE